MKIKNFKLFVNYINESKLDIDPRSPEAEKKLRFACSDGNLEEVKSLIEQGVDPNNRRGICLLWEEDSKNKELVKFLLPLVDTSKTPNPGHWIELTLDKKFGV